MKKKLSRFIVMLVVTCIFSCVTVFGATVGEKLVEPEEGWQRIDDSDKNIVYSSSIGSTTYKWGNEEPYKGSYHRLRYPTNSGELEALVSSNIKFKFYGSKFRLVDTIGPTESTSNSFERMTTDLRVKIDEREYSVDCSSDKIASQVLLLDVVDLDYGVHEVQISASNMMMNNCVYFFDCFDINEDGYILPYDSDNTILNIEADKSTVNVYDRVLASLYIDNIANISAEDIYIKYDSEKLQYIGCEEVEGIKLVYNDEKDGILRFILASKGEDNIINAKKTLLNLNFKAIAPGEALVDITKGRITDGIEMEKDVEEALCGQAIITIEAAQITDVNNSGEFTLLDLGIDARHFGEDPKAEELTKYNTDIVLNDAIDDDDLLKIGQLMLANDNYAFNR